MYSSLARCMSFSSADSRFACEPATISWMRPAYTRVLYLVFLWLGLRQGLYQEFDLLGFHDKVLYELLLVRYTLPCTSRSTVSVWRGVPSNTSSGSYFSVFLCFVTGMFSLICTKFVRVVR